MRLSALRELTRWQWARVVAGTAGVVGSRVRVQGKNGRCYGVQYICGGDGRGGQRPPSARFALQPGVYQVEVRYSSGIVRGKQFVVANTPIRGIVDDQAPRVEQ